MIVVAVAAVAVAQARVRTFSLAGVHSAVEQNVGWNKVRYVLGGESRAAYLRSFFGCEYDATVRAAQGEVAVREGSLAPWWDRRFRPLVSHGSTAAAVRRELRPFKWVYARGGTAETITPNPVARRVLAERARLVWRRDECALYRLE
jgi:hypothetical protein